MSYGTALKDLLAPLGVYRWDGSFQEAALNGVAVALDRCASELEGIEKEMNLVTAEGLGLERLRSLLRKSPAAETTEQLREALAALLRIGDDSFTLESINDTINGCGIRAQVEETETAGEVILRFPGVRGIPAGFPELKSIIEDIIPCHLTIHYLFWYLTWSELESQFPTWSSLEAQNLTWSELETKAILPD